MAACRPAPAPAHEGYVWQRVWTPEVREGIAAARPLFAGLRVNALAIGEEGTLSHPVDLPALVGVRVTVVARVDATGPVDAAALAPRLAATAARWRAAGIDVVGVEVDHDCATAALPAYAEAVRRLRADLPPDLRLSITALPTWATSPALDDLLAAADAAVVQVHAVRAPAEGLFSPEHARTAVASVLAHTAHPLWVAVPAYGMRVGSDELRVAPGDVTAFLADLDPRVAGVVWFRVPTGDARDWPLTAISAVIHGEVPVGSASVAVTGASGGAFDLSLSNPGEAWVALPERLAVRGDCGAADAVGGYTVDRSEGLAFVRADRAPLDPGQTRAVGWVRCAAPPEIR